MIVKKTVRGQLSYKPGDWKQPSSPRLTLGIFVPEYFDIHQERRRKTSGGRQKVTCGGLNIHLSKHAMSVNCNSQQIVK
jgi:hypothetical protein